MGACPKCGRGKIKQRCPKCGPKGNPLPTAETFSDCSYTPQGGLSAWGCWVRFDGVEHTTSAFLKKPMKNQREAELAAIIKTLYFAREKFPLAPHISLGVWQSPALDVLRGTAKPTAFEYYNILPFYRKLGIPHRLVVQGIKKDDLKRKYLNNKCDLLPSHCQTIGHQMYGKGTNHA